jgi:hypothetical protein
MKILFLSSVIPYTKHYTAASTVLASLIKQSTIQKNITDLYILDNNLDLKLEKKFKKNYLNKIKFYATKKFSSINYIYKIIRFFFIVLFKFDIFPIVNKSVFKKIKDDLETAKYDLVILFWDTKFEYILPFIKSQNTFGYLAVPPHSASIILHNHFLKFKNFYYKIKLKYFKNLQDIHIKNLKSLKSASNICNITKNWYRDRSINCTYIPNCWENFSKIYSSKYLKKKDVEFNICSSIGGLNATGNYFGIKYLADFILPKINKKYLLFNIYGRYKLHKELLYLKKNKFLRFRGFVKDIDNEVIKSKFCLILNNAYNKSLIGGYTRVIYFFSLGKCLIAHSNLKKSMPELQNNYNCLLGNSSKKIIELINRSVKDKRIIKKIEFNAKKTFYQKYSSKIIFNQILKKASRE